MKLIAVSVGLPQIIKTPDEGFVTTGIFKQPVDGPVAVNELNLEGDAQADLRVHGGWSKAVYAYPVEHYEFWRNELPDADLTHGNFGENLTVEGFSERDVFIGDRIAIGTAEFVVTEPRLPCYKLGIRFGRKDILRRFLQSRRTGFYLAVEKTGVLEAGQPISVLSKDASQVSIHDIVRIWVEDKKDRETMSRALLVDSLPESWKDSFRERLGDDQAS